MPSKGRSGAASSQFWARMAIRSMVSEKLKSEIILRLGNADCAGTTGCEPHWATPETPILGPIHRAPKIEVQWLTNMIRVHAQVALVHKLSGAHQNIVDNFGHIHGRSVIDAIPLRNSPAILVLGIIACKRATDCPSARRIFAAEREKLRRSNLLHFDGRAWTTNCHRDRATLSAHKGDPERAPPQDSLASRQMSETQN